MSLIAELKQRKLVQWALAYAAAAFALLQGVDIVAQRFGWPEAYERVSSRCASGSSSRCCWPGTTVTAARRKSPAPSC